MSDQHASHDGLGRLLSVIDEPADDVPPAFGDALWSELSVALRERSVGSTGSRNVIDLSDRGPDVARSDQGARRRRGRRFTVAAAAVALLAGAIYLAGDRDPTISTTSDDTVDPVTAAPEVTAQPALIDPVAACERYLATQPTLVELIDRLEDGGPSPLPAEVDAAADAIEVLRNDLDASGVYLERQYAPLDLAIASLGQARIELIDGERTRALGSVENASNQLSSVDLPGIAPFRSICAPTG